MADVPAGFAGLLRHLRYSAGLTQEELADRAGVGVNTISELERGRHLKCHVQTARRLAAGLDLTGEPQQAFIAAARGLIPATAGSGASGGASQAGVRYSLPPDTTAFTGRAGELDQLTAAVTSAAAAVDGVPIQAIGGMPGAGKTALAVHAAHLLRQEFPDRQLFINLHAHTPGQEPVRPADALAGLLTTTGVDPRFLPADLDGRAGMWRDRMAGQRALLVLDNAASSGQVTPLLPGAPGCLVLVTSRRHLGDLPGAVAPVLLDALAAREAAEMFTRLAPRAAGSPDEVAEVVQRAGFLPLAICLLARVFARHPSWTLADLVAETRASLLTLTAENDSIAVAFEVSYRHLRPARQRFFRLLGQHPGVTTDAYAAAALAGTSLAEAVGLLDGLHAEGLLTETGHRRYGMHDLLRRYALDRAAADPADQGERALGRLLDYYQFAAGRAQARLARQSRPGPAPAAPAGTPAVPDLEATSDALAWARADRASLLACLDHATRTGQHGRVVALTAGLAGFLRHDGPWADAITRHTAAVEAARQLGNRLGQAGALTDLADVRRMTGDYPGATQAAEQALGIYRDLGDRLGQANTLHVLGEVRRATGDYPGAARALEQALAFYRDLGDRLGQANTLHALGTMWKATGDWPGAARALEQALGIYRDLADRLGQADVIHILGTVRALTGDYPGAAQAAEQALGIYRDSGDRLGQANSLRTLANVRLDTGDYPDTTRALEQALAIYRDLGYRLGEANTLHTVADVARVTGDHPAATQALGQSLAIYRDLGDRLGQANALMYLGGVRRETGDYQAATEALEQALAIYHELGNRSGTTQALNERGTVHRLSGELALAEQCHQHALELARDILSPWDQAHALAGLGRCAIAANDTARAGSLLRQAHEIFQRIGTADAPFVLAELNAFTTAESAQ